MAAVAAPTRQFTAVRALWLREVVRFVRQRNRVIGALLTPVVFWLLLGSGLNHTFTPAPAPGSGALASATSGGGAAISGGGGPGYLLYFFPGALMLVKKK